MGTERRIIIVDDHPIFRAGLRQVIEADRELKVVAEAGEGETALRLIEELLPDVAVLDVDMPKLDGFGLAQAIQRQRLPVRLIFLTIHDEEDIINEALDSGVTGYVLKESAVTDIVSGIKGVLAGQHYLSPSLTSILVNRSRRAESLVSKNPSLKDLTPTERRVLSMIAECKTSKEIADEMYISYRTVENHRTNICNKLDLHGSHALLKFALRHKSELS